MKSESSVCTKTFEETRTQVHASINQMFSVYRVKLQIEFCPESVANYRSSEARVELENKIQRVSGRAFGDNSEGGERFSNGDPFRTSTTLSR